MTITSGSRLGPYEVIAPIGAGGMGEVFKARDTRLERSVAIKVLPAEVANNAQLKLRFEREAKTISQLSHPNICTLYDVGDNYLVMELLDGETLADRISRGPLPLEQVIRIGTEIANALDRAHKAGVVHRDLKPSNVMLTKSGAKLLDFGLARTDSSVLGPRSSVVETMRKSLTEEGAIVGTIQYMAPEQLEGGEVDARTDVFAFGAVLYEMVTGRRAFGGKSKASVIASILGGEPQPITAWQPASPAALDRLIRTCLTKDPDERWQNAHDVAIELRTIAEQRPQALPRRGAGWLLPIAAAFIAAIATWATLEYRKTAPHLIVSSILPPSKGLDNPFSFDRGGAPAISPDGTRIVFTARSSTTQTMLYVRPLNGDSAQPLAGTEGATMPFWSPDSRSIGFFSNGKMKKIDAAGGPITLLADTPLTRGGSWSSAGVIVFSPTNASCLYKVSEDGGAVTPASQLGVTESLHRFPAFLPDGHHFLYQALTYGGSAIPRGTIYVGSIDDKNRKAIVDANSQAVYASSGHIVYMRDLALVAQKFDLKSMAVASKTTTLADSVGRSQIGQAIFSISNDGTLIYAGGDFFQKSLLQWFDASGKLLETVHKPEDMRSPSLSHDGRRIAMSVLDPATTTTSIWIHDLVRNATSRLTFSGGNEFVPVWSPDDTFVAYGASAHSAGELVIKRSSGIGSEEVLYSSSHFKIPYDFSPDGSIIAFQDQAPDTNWDIWFYTFKDHQARPFVRSPAQEIDPKFSPDGRWIVYQSDESVRGHPQIYVLPVSGAHGKWQISSDGGRTPRWTADGKRIFYVSEDSVLMSVDVEIRGDEFTAAVPVALFPISFPSTPGTQFDVSRDGKRFLLNVAAPGGDDSPLMLMQNWTAKLK